MAEIIFRKGEYQPRMEKGQLCVVCDADLAGQKISAINGGSRIPYDDILSAYHRRLPALPKVRVFSAGLKRNIRARWNEDAERQNQGWWEMYFAHVGGCPFLLGENKRNWRASFSWLMKSGNLAKVINDEYRENSAKKKTDKGETETERRLGQLGL
jgi:hypothetical protein